MIRRLRSAMPVVFWGVLCVQGLGQQVVVQANATPTTSLRQISKADYLSQIEQMQALLNRCQKSSDACDAKAVPEDASVDQGSFEVHWYWLRDAVGKARTANAADRTSLLQTATERLSDDATDAGSPAPAELNAVTDARKKTDAILSQREFRRVEQNSYLDTKIAAFFALLNRLFSGAAGLLPHSPWIAAALEWGLLALAAAGLLIWAWRLSKQQRLVIAEVRDTTDAPWRQESENWAERAAAEAMRGEWREAVHCLYWSAIVLLEGQKMWRQNRARTPREYVQLLEAGSEKQRALGGLTRVFERIWYGLRPAAESDYLQASRLLEQLRVG